MKSFLQVELKEIKNEISDLKKGLQEVTQKTLQLEAKTGKSDKDLQSLKDQNRAMQASIVTMEFKALDNFIRLRGVMEEKGENIFDVVSSLLSEYLGEQSEDIEPSLES